MESFGSPCPSGGRSVWVEARCVVVRIPCPGCRCKVGRKGGGFGTGTRTLARLVSGGRPQAPPADPPARAEPNKPKSPTPPPPRPEETRLPAPTPPERLTHP